MDVFMDIPASNAAGALLRGDRPAEPVFETARMYRGGSIPEDASRIFGVTTLELG